MYEALIGPRTDVSGYAWIITKDHLNLDDVLEGDCDDTGTIGPDNADPALIAQLEEGKGHVFRMYDDDGELYYTGRLVTRSGDMELIPVTYASGLDDQIDPCYAPLSDFGLPNAGCVEIRWHGRPEWGCG
jgi:hypothetical protein